MTGFIDHMQFPLIAKLAPALTDRYPDLFGEAVAAINLFFPSPEVHIQNLDDVRLFILPLKWRGAMADQLEQLPNASQILEAVPEAVKIARLPFVHSFMFSMSMPGCELVPHIDNESHLGEVYRLHLGLSCPVGDCALIVGDERREWRNGEVFMFDSARVEHSAHNRTAVPRLIAIVDIERRLLEP